MVWLRVLLVLISRIFMGFVLGEGSLVCVVVSGLVIGVCFVDCKVGVFNGYVVLYVGVCGCG